MSALMNRVRHIAGSFANMFVLTNTVIPDENHLEHLRRRFLSPATQASTLLELFKLDPAFVKCLPEGVDDYLVTIALCGHELRANVYHLCEDELGPRRAFDPNWANNGFFHFHLASDKTMQLLSRDSIPHLGYNPYEPVRSYARPITVSEEHLLDGLWCKSYN